MPDETNESKQPDEAVVEVSEQELADLGDFLAQVQIVLIGHEQRIAVIESALFDKGDADGSELPIEGDSGSADGDSAIDGEEGSAGSSDAEDVVGGEPSDL